MKNLLYITNIAGIKFSYAFCGSALKAAKRIGFKFYVVANRSLSDKELIKEDELKYDISLLHADIQRTPYNVNNIRAIKEISTIIREKNIDYIHCNTPVGGVIGRLMNRHVKKVIYQAHGFHFYKGAPIKNWLIYYPVEKILARRTDGIITINKDDYKFAKKHLKSKIYYVPGVGIQLEQWNEYRDIREELGIGLQDFVVLVVGRLEKNKNCGTVIEAVRKVPTVKLVFCGDGEDRQKLEEKAKGIEERVFFLGNRSNMSDIYHMADCFVLASFREGLSRSIMEAMACGLPCLVTDIRGNRDLVDKDYLFNPTDVDGLAEMIRKVSESKELKNKMKARNLEKIKEFSFDRVVNELSKIYKEVYELEKA